MYKYDKEHETQKREYKSHDDDTHGKIYHILSFNLNLLRTQTLLIFDECNVIQFRLSLFKSHLLLLN